ncbi:MAG: lipopolysaccharide biosynthesis protein, partial [Bacteriovoracia bacterium]
MNADIKHKRQFFKNFFSSAVTNVILIAVNIILVPFIIQKIGLASYGLFTLVRTFSSEGGYLNLFELGFSSALAKRVSEDLNLNKTENIIRKTVSTFYFFLILSLFISLSGVIFKSTILSTFDLSLADMSSTSVALTIMILSSIYVLPNYAMSGTIFGFQKFDLYKINETASKMIYAVCIFIFLSLENAGVLELVIIYCFSLFLKFLFDLLTIKKLLPNFNLSFRKISFQQLKDLLQMALQLFTGKLSTIIINNAPKTLLAGFYDLTAVANYEVVFKVMNLLKSIFNVVSSVIMPTAATFKDDVKKSHNLVYMALRLQMYVSLPVIFILAFKSPELYKYWLGDEFVHLAPLLIIGLGWNLTLPISSVINACLIGTRNKLQKLPFIWLGNAAIFTAIASLLLLFFREKAILLAFVISGAIYAAAYLYLGKKDWFLSPLKILVSLLKVSLISLIAASTLIPIDYLLPDNVFTFALQLILGELIAVSLLFIFVLHEHEKQEITPFFEKIFQKTKLKSLYLRYTKLLSYIYIPTSVRSYLKDVNIKPNSSKSSIVLFEKIDSYPVVHLQRMINEVCSNRMNTTAKWFKFEASLLDRFRIPPNLRLNYIYEKLQIKPSILQYQRVKKQNVRKLFDDVKSKIHTRRDLLELTVRDIKIGDLVYDTYLRRESKATIDIKSRDWHKYLYFSLQTIVLCEKFFKNNNVKAIFPGDVAYIYSGIIVRVADKFDIPSYITTLTCDEIIKMEAPDFVRLKPYYRYHQDFLKLSSEQQDKAFKKAQKRLDEHFGGGKTLTYMNKSSFSSSAKKFSYSRDKTNVLFFFHCFFDSPHIYRYTLFDDFWQWA